MDGTNIIMGLIIACIAIMILFLFSQPIKVFMRVVISSFLGAVGIYFFNMFFPTVAIGINAVTVGTVGLLGLPGFATLIIAGLVL